MGNWQAGLFGLIVGVCVSIIMITKGIRRFGLSRQFAELAGIDADVEREVYVTIGKELIADSIIFDQETRKKYPVRIGRDTLVELGKELISHGDQFDPEMIRDRVYGLEMQRRKQFYLTKK